MLIVTYKPSILSVIMLNVVMLNVVAPKINRQLMVWLVDKTVGYFFH